MPAASANPAQRHPGARERPRAKRQIATRTATPRRPSQICPNRVRVSTTATTPCGTTAPSGLPLSCAASTKSHPAPETSASSRLAQASCDSRRSNRGAERGAAIKQRKVKTPANDIVEA